MMMFVFSSSIKKRDQTLSEPYFEPQTLNATCGIHAVNMILGFKKYTWPDTKITKNKTTQISGKALLDQKISDIFRGNNFLQTWLRKDKMDMPLRRFADLVQESHSDIFDNLFLMESRLKAKDFAKLMKDFNSFPNPIKNGYPIWLQAAEEKQTADTTQAKLQSSGQLREEIQTLFELFKNKEDSKIPAQIQKICTLVKA